MKKTVMTVLKWVITIVLLLFMTQMFIVVLFQNLNVRIALTLIKYIAYYCIAATVLLIIHINTIYSEKKMRRYIKLYFVLLFIIYFALLFKYVYFEGRLSYHNWGWVVKVLSILPMGFFLPIFFRKLQKFHWFIISLTILCIGFELVPHLYYGKYFDIYKVIFQLITAVIVFGLLKIPVIQKFLTKLNII